MKIGTNCDNINAICDNISTNCDNISTSHHIYRKLDPKLGGKSLARQERFQ